MNLSKYKACICEGAGEAAIIDILVDNDLLIFKREEMSTTELGNMVAIPHAMSNDSEEAVVSVMILKKPILWENENRPEAVGAQRKADFRTEAAVHKDLRGQRQGQAE